MSSGNLPKTLEERKAAAAERRLQRILNTCVHDLGNPAAPRCCAGVEYASVRRYRPGTGGYFDLPCTSPEVDTCTKRRHQTREDFERQEEESQQNIERVHKVREIITIATSASPQAKDTTIQGAFKCPCCDHGRVRFSVAPNGHANATCSTPGCVSFIE